KLLDRACDHESYAGCGSEADRKTPVTGLLLTVFPDVGNRRQRRALEQLRQFLRPSDRAVHQFESDDCSQAEHESGRKAEPRDVFAIRAQAVLRRRGWLD